MIHIDLFDIECTITMYFHYREKYQEYCLKNNKAARR